MLTLANVSAAQAENYYEKDDYYTQGESDLSSDTQWHGQGAQALHLTGPVDKQIFQQLLHGQTPDSKPLHSRKIDPTTHRAGTDYTFSAPKSVSIAALIQKDKRVLTAHDQAVNVALSVLENRYAQTRIRRGPKIRDRVLTGNIIAATFRHETSREQDPQLHTHCVIINATQLPNGKWQSLSNDDVLNNQKLLGEIYQNELAHNLRQLGYDIDPQGNGLFECQGYDESLLNLFSTRTQQIESYIERWETALKQQGGKPLHASQKKQATLATRLRKKSVPRDVLLDGWQRAIKERKIHLPAIPETAPETLQTQAAISATAGVTHAAERESVFKREKAERFALENHLGQQTFAELQTAMTAAGLIPAKDRYTTTAAIDRELATIEIMESGQGQVQPIATGLDVLNHTNKETSLTTGQYQAILDTATTTDQFIAWQGVAGAGKTYSLNLLTQLAREQGYKVTGYAPSAEAANVLQTEAHIESRTVAKLLHDEQFTDYLKHSNQPQIWIVDEAGLLSAKAAHELLQKAQQNQARVILVGDTRQLSAVEAGNPFKSLQKAGLKTSYLEESRRQKTDALKAAVVCLAAEEQLAGLQELDRAGMIHELKDTEFRHQSITLEYMALPFEARSKTLILSGTNHERLELTAQLRSALQKERSLSTDRFTLQSLRPQDRTEAQRKYACTYDIGDVVIPAIDYRRYGMKRKQLYRVIDRDLKANRLTLENPDGQPFTFNPATCTEKRTYRVQELPLAEGDQLRWTRNEAIPGVRNGQQVTVESLSVTSKATLKTDKGDLIELNLNGHQYLDYALVSTTYGSQGKTADQVIVSTDSTLSKESLYVAVSRARYNLSLYTGDQQQLTQHAQRSSANQNPSDHLTLYQLVNPHAQDPKAARTPRLLRGAAQSEYLGDRVGERVKVSHRAPVRRDPSIETATAGFSLRHRGYAASARQAVRAISEQLERRRQQQRVKRLDPQRGPTEIYQEYAAQVSSQSVYDHDQLVAQRLFQKLLDNQAKPRPFTQEEVQMVGMVMQAGPLAQQLEWLQGKDAARQHVAEVLQKAVKQVAPKRQRQVYRPSQRSQERDQGMER